MNIWIAIDLGGGGLEDLRFNPLGQAEHVDCAVHACLRRLHRVMLVMDRRGRACQVVNLIDLQIKWERDIVADQFKMLVIEEVLDVASGAGKEVVNTEDQRTVRKQMPTQMRAEEAGTTRH